LRILSPLTYAIELCENRFKKYQFSQISVAIYNFWIPEIEDFYPDEPNLEQQNR
jgi:valyl-tRNA synthetase